MGTESDGRMTRGMAIFNSKAIKENEIGVSTVPSQTNASTSYEVKITDSKWTCNCPDFTTRIIDACKHIYVVKFWIVTNTYFRPKSKPVVSIPCDKCGSSKIIKFGFDCGKQTFYCKECNHKFREPSLLTKAKFTPELISLTLDLYFSGSSLRRSRAMFQTISISILISLPFTTGFVSTFLSICQFVNTSAIRYMACR